MLPRMVPRPAVHNRSLRARQRAGAGFLVAGARHSLARAGVGGPGCCCRDSRPRPPALVLAACRGRSCGTCIPVVAASRRRAWRTNRRLRPCVVRRDERLCRRRLRASVCARSHRTTSVEQVACPHAALASVCGLVAPVHYLVPERAVRRTWSDRDRRFDDREVVGASQATRPRPRS